MQRLAGSDAGFLFVETPTMTSSCLDLAVLSPSDADTPPLTLDGLRDHVAARLDLLPSWRWRLEPVPLGIAHPMWIEDPDFDLGYHLRETTLPVPGSPDRLDELFRELLPQMLDLRHPAWQLLLVHGLEGGRQAIIFRFHHALADGAALITTLDRLFGPPAAEPTSWTPEHVRRRDLLTASVKAQAKAWAATPALLRDTMERFRAVESRRSATEIEVPASMGGAPWTVLNRASSAERAFARTRLPITELQRVKAASGAPLSDVLLTVVAGALRAYLGRRDQLPEEPLVVNVPVSNDPADAPARQHGNRFANFFAHLDTGTADPWARLANVTASTAEAKVQLDLLGTNTLPTWLDQLPPAIARPAARGLNRSHMRKHAADFNVLVSNVRTNGASWRIANLGIDHLWMSGPPADAAGLNITVTGFGPDLHIAIVSVPTALAHPDELAAELTIALDALVASIPASPSTSIPALTSEA